MKTKTKFVQAFSLPAGIVLLLLFSSCTAELTYTEALDKNRRTIDNEEKMEDAEFLVEAKSFALLQEEINKLASDTGYASSVADLGADLLQDNLNLQEDLEDLAKQEDIKLPTVMNDEHQEMYDELTDADREDFDQTYIRIVKDANEESTEEYMEMATEAYDADVRAFSARSLDMLESHAENIEEVEEELLSTY